MLCLSNACILICSMAPVRQSARQRARGRPVQPSDPAAVDPPRRLATAAATGVAQRRLRATSHVQQDTTASLRKDLNEIRDLLRSVLPVAPATTPVQVAGPSVPSEPPLPPLDMPGAGSVAPPWPTTIDTQPPMASSAGIVETVLNLPGPTQARVSRLITNSLSIHSHVPQKTRLKIWSDEFVDISSLLPEVSLVPQEMTLTVRPGGNDGGPSVCVTPKPKSESRTFYSWSKAFDIFCSVYLLKPGNTMQATKLFQYRHIIRNLMERGGDWRGYDESFRTMRAVEGWEWDEMHSQLWLMAAQQPIPKLAPQVRTPFLGRGAGLRIAPTRCNAYNNRGSCPYNPCKYRHLCRICGGAHPAIKCPTRKRSSIPNQQGGFR